MEIGDGEAIALGDVPGDVDAVAGVATLPCDGVIDPAEPAAELGALAPPDPAGSSCVLPAWLPTWISTISPSPSPSSRYCTWLSLGVGGSMASDRPTCVTEHVTRGAALY